MSSLKKSSIADTYKKKTEKEHILDTPDTYIGSIEKIEEPLCVYNTEYQKIKLKNIEYIPGLYKLFDEVIINARDHIVRIITAQNNITDINEKKKLKNVSYINVSVDKKTGIIVIENDGNGIDIIKHPEHNIWIPELIFAHLRTSTNYNKEEKRIVGGKNGFGVKLVFIWSTWGKIETIDHIRKLHYTQTFENNLDIINEPIINKINAIELKNPYTRISFIPDYARLGLNPNENGDILSEDLMSLLQKRVYDIAGVSDHSVKKVIIRFNEIPVPIKNFQQYIETYIGSEKKVYEESGTRWEYCISICESGEFTQISFVNGICTYKGGKHVDYLINQITRKLVEYIEKKKNVKVTAGSIKEQLILFLRCDIENPVFGSQTKDYLDLPSSKFGSLPTVSESFIDKVAKLGVMATACALTEVKEEKNAKKTDGTKSRTIRGIPNFDDAINSGGSDSKNCTLILAEGNSAKSGIISGISSEQRKFIGIFALKGKPINCRNETVSKISANKEITYLKQILGLEYKKEYTDISQLRYGKVQILSDQDLDGAHIKGLIVNIFDTLWPSLLKIDGFLSFMNTPILRATPKSKKNTIPLFFYNTGEIETWKNSEDIHLQQYDFKYLKGLGSSTAIEFKKYFQDNKYVDFIYNGDVSKDCIDKVFNKARPDDRKKWLENYDKDAYLNTNNTKVSLEDFIDKEMIHFSIYDCERSICGFDGLKISQRKTLYVAFKRNITKEIKVAQFAASVSELSSYHHGETSLVGTIINLAQDYVGSNNINILEPKGSFGSRLHLGEDHASERYIFTNLSPITRKIFNELDDNILEYLDDDGFSIEPQFYIPIIPYVLINGVKGIGTGFSTSIEPCNPLDILNYIKYKLNKIENTIEDFVPYYEGFKGTIKQIEKNKYLIKGCYNIIGDSVKITELPIYTATDKYKEFLEGLTDGSVDKNGKKILPIIKDFINLSTDKIVDITIQFPKGDIEKIMNQSIDINGINGIEKILKLTTTVSNTNMHIFNEDLKLHKYNTIPEIIDYFMNVRLVYYEKRKTYITNELKSQLIKLSNKARFIKMCLSGSIDLRKKTNSQIDELMIENVFTKIDDSYDYLIKIPMNSVSKENVDRLMKEETDKENELEILKKTSLEEMWINDLNELEEEYIKYKKCRELNNVVENNIIQNNVITKKTRK
jgi:DNA topoisomerase-2